MPVFPDLIAQFRTKFTEAEQKLILDYHNAGSTKKKWIAFIGGAVAGLGAAWLLHSLHIFF